MSHVALHLDFSFPDILLKLVTNIKYFPDWLQK